jgi:hypothetical protein
MPLLLWERPEMAVQNTFPKQYMVSMQQKEQPVITVTLVQLQNAVAAHIILLLMAVVLLVMAVWPMWLLPLPREEYPGLVNLIVEAVIKGVSGVGTGTTLYKNAHGHGNLFCSACHGSPHAMVPSLVAKDNYQATQYQGSSRPVKSISSCGVCHKSSRGGDATIQDFAEKHAGISPLVKIACHTSHTSITKETAKWPHAFQWKDSGGNPKGVSD